MTHLIQRQYIHVDLQGSESEGFALQNRLAELCSEWLNPAIERLLDRCAPPEGRLCIDRLEVDAGALSFENIEQGLTEAVVQALEKALREQIPPGAAFSSPAGTDIRVKSEQQTAAEAFQYFLETGRLPWSFKLPSGISFEQFLLDVWRSESGVDSDTIPPMFPAQLSRTSLVRTLASPQVRQRLVLQFSGPFLHALLQQLSPEVHTSVVRIFEAVRAASAALRPDAERRSLYEKQLWQTAFRQAAQPFAAGDIDLIAHVFAATPEVASPVLPALKDILHPADLPVFVRQVAKHSGSAFSVLAPLLEQSLKAISNPLLPEIQSLLKAGAAPGRPPVRKPTKASVPGATEMEQPTTAGTPSSLGGMPEEGLYVDNAGLVILHPFLLMFFENLGIARAGALVQRDRALHLLHYLCTGHTPAPEYELVLPKILCNIPLEAPVESDVVLTGNETSEANSLLESAIRWWEALRSTSPDGLRGAFLCRPGKLSVRSDGDWLLQVERQSYDVLLDQLPWGISVVRLPWMGKMVWVEWG